MNTNTTEARSNRVIAEYRRPANFAGASARQDLFLKVNGAAVAKAGAQHSLYFIAATDDLIEMAQAHLYAMNFRGLKITSRATALAALIGIRIHTDLVVR